MKPTIRSGITAVTLAGLTAQAWALGYRNPDQGARATAQGEAFVAQADDASAIHYNPAGLTQVKGTQFTSGSYISFSNIEFKLAGGGSVSAKDKAAILPHLYASSDFGLERWRFGLGVNVPFGTAVEYSKSGPFQFLVTKSELMVLNLAPTVACQVTDTLAVGASVNVYYGETTVERNVPLVVIPDDPNPPIVVSPGGAFQFEGDGWGVGATASLLWKPNDRHAVGVVYRSPFRIEMDGRAKLANSPVLGNYRESAAATLEFPQQLAVGYAFRPTRKLKLEVDVEWTDWDSLNVVKLRTNGPVFNGQPTPFNWMSSWYYEFGVEYACHNQWTLRAGYIYSENTVPNSTLNPTLPDSNRHVFSAGVGFTARRWTMDLAYQFSLSEKRRQTLDTNLDGAPDLAGKWDNTGHALMITSTFRF